MPMSFRSYFRKTPRSYVNGLFGLSDLKKPADFPRIAADRVMEARKVMDEWKTSAGTRSSIEDIGILDGVSNSLCLIADAAELIRNVEDDPHWIDCATEAVQQVSSFMTEANISTEFYNRAESISRVVGHELAVDQEHKSVINSMVESMRNEGVALPLEQKERLISLQTDDVSKSFNIVQSSSGSSENDGSWIILPAELQTSPLIRVLPKRVFNGKDEIKVPSNQPGVLSELMRNAQSRQTRQALWEAGRIVTQATREKEELMQQLVQIRRELASIRGYSTWNDYAQRESILSPLGGPPAVKKFLIDLWEDMCPGLSRELNVLLELNGGNQVEPWDVDYLMKSWRSQNRSSTASIDIIQSKLSFPRIMAGAQRVLDKVFEVDLLYDRTAGPLWNEDAFRLSLSRGREPAFAYLYVDPYTRDSKSVQSAQFTISGSKVLPNGTRQIPQTALVLSVPKQSGGPLPLSIAQTFFHELGHAMHSLLSETTLQHFSGSRGAIDFVEFPSHLFEHFTTEPECLRTLLSGDVHDSIIEHYAFNRNPFAHIEAVQQLTYALVDQVYYATGSVDRIADYLPHSDLVDKSKLLEILQPQSVANFEHLVHYGGSYYTYLLSRVISADVWDKSFRKSPFSRETGVRLENFLKGGSVNQSLESIYSITGSMIPENGLCNASFLSELRSCSAIHRP
jgi:intermediate peptidase